MNAFKDLTQQAEQLSRQRHQLGERFRQTGLSGLGSAWRGEFRNKRQLSESYAQLVKALQHNRKDAEAYLGLAYLQLLVGNQVMAVRYLKEGLRAVPGHAGLQDLLTELARPVRPAAPARDGGAEQIQARIDALLKQILRLKASSWPCLEPDQLADQKRLYHQQLTEQARIGKALLELERQFETAALQLRFQAVEVQLRQWRQDLEISRQGLELSQEVLKYESELAVTFAQLAAYSPTQREAWLETIYDRCDIFADRLDQIETRGYGIETLKQVYKRLILRVEASTERIDELFTGAP